MCLAKTVRSDPEYASVSNLYPKECTSKPRLDCPLTIKRVDLIVKGGTSVMLRYSSIVSFLEAGVIASTSPPGANDQTAPDVNMNSRS